MHTIVVRLAVALFERIICMAAHTIITAILIYGLSLVLSLIKIHPAFVMPAQSTCGMHWRSLILYAEASIINRLKWFIKFDAQSQYSVAT